MTMAPIFRFASTRTANRLVAGVPAAARLARAYAAARPGEALALATGDGGSLSPLTRAEIARLAPGLAIAPAPADAQPAIPGETLPDPAAIAALLAGDLPLPAAPARPEAALAAAGRAIIRATAKPGDGLVARHLNRPISQAMSAQLLRFAWIRPGHATALTALAALAMLACLIAAPDPDGLAAGAVLFQLASVIDGVDGEIARATHRSSRSGASLDSLVDAFTNCGFIAGAAYSFAMQGDLIVAWICAAAAGVQATGLAILGTRAWQREGVVHFNSAKASFDTAPHRSTRLVRDFASRDFYCFAFMLTAFFGLLDLAMIVFLTASVVWLIVVIKQAR